MNPSNPARIGRLGRFRSLQDLSSLDDFEEKMKLTQESLARLKLTGEESNDRDIQDWVIFAKASADLIFTAGDRLKSHLVQRVNEQPVPNNPPENNIRNEMLPVELLMGLAKQENGASNIPKFVKDMKRLENPLRYLSELKSYVDVVRPQTTEELLAIISQSLKGTGDSWFYAVKHKILWWDDFENMFQGTFWNASVRTAFERKLNLARYNELTGLTRFDYAARLIGVARDLEMPDERVLRVAIRHFLDDAQLCMKLHHAQTTELFLSMIKEYEDDERIFGGPEYPFVPDILVFDGDRPDLPEEN